MYPKLKEIRKAKGYSIQDMGKVINKSGVTYFNKEEGNVKFTLTEALKIAKFLKKKVEDIFFTPNISQNEKSC